MRQVGDGLAVWHRHGRYNPMMVVKSAALAMRVEHPMHEGHDTMCVCNQTHVVALSLSLLSLLSLCFVVAVVAVLLFVAIVLLSSPGSMLRC